MSKKFNSAFKKWFGKSKVVDENGEPLKVYHGTCASFDTFDKKAKNSGTGCNGEVGFFFTSEHDLASDFTTENWSKSDSKFKENAAIMPVYIKITNPYYITAFRFTLNVLQTQEYYKELGYDGIIITPFSDEEKVLWKKLWKDDAYKEFVTNQYVVFESNQIKSATGNDGTFDIDDDSILSGTKGKSKSKITETPAFKKWFGKSKVVDEKGVPLVVYHGTFENFNKFRTPAYFAKSPKVANEFVDPEFLGYKLEEYEIPKIYACYLSLKNPKIYTTDDEYEDLVMEIQPKLVKELQKAGYDGVIFNPEYGSEGIYYVVFSPSQIKSATGNDGTFDIDDDSILSGSSEAIKYEMTDSNVGEVKSAFKDFVDYSLKHKGIKRNFLVKNATDKTEYLFTSDSIRHIKNNHGNISELKRGQIPVTPELYPLLIDLIIKPDNKTITNKYKFYKHTKFIELEKSFENIGIAISISGISSRGRIELITGFIKKIAELTDELAPILTSGNAALPKGINETGENMLHGVDGKEAIICTDDCLSKGILHIKEISIAGEELIKLAYQRMVIDPKRFNDFGKELLKIDKKEKDVTGKVSEIIRGFLTPAKKQEFLKNRWQRARISHGTKYPEYLNFIGEMLGKESAKMPDELSKLLKSYKQLKEKLPESVVLIGNKEEYFAFGKDAGIVSKVLKIDIQKLPVGLHFVSFGHYSLEQNMPKIVKAGYRVAVADSIGGLSGLSDQRTKIDASMMRYYKIKYSGTYDYYEHKEYWKIIDNLIGVETI